MKYNTDELIEIASNIKENDKKCFYITATTYFTSYFLNSEFEIPFWFVPSLILYSILERKSKIPNKKFNEALKQSELRNNYQKILTDFNKLLDSSDLKDSTELFTGYFYALRNGYLSVNKDFYYSTTPVDLPNNYGMDIFKGQAACRHTSNFLVDLYKNRGLNSFEISVKVDMNYSSKVDKLMELNNFSNYLLENNKDIFDALYNGKDFQKGNKEIDEETKKVLKSIIENIKYEKNFENHMDKHKILKVIEKIHPNHSITGCKSNGKLYILDPTNFEGIKKDGKKLINIQDENNEFKYFNIFNRKCFREIAKSNTISEEEYLTSINEGYDKCLINRKIFEDFHNTHRKDYKQIVQDSYRVRSHIK